MPIKRDTIEGHISNMGHLFPMRDYKKHTYLAIPELLLLKEGDGTPVEARSEAMDHTTPPDVTESVRAVASTRSVTTAESQPQPTQPLPPHPGSHNLEVGSAVELVDPPGYGIIRWIGKFPDVPKVIAGVEMVSCVLLLQLFGSNFVLQCICGVRSFEGNSEIHTKSEAKVIIKRELAGMCLTCNTEIGISPIPMIYIYCFTGLGGPTR